MMKNKNKKKKVKSIDWKNISKRPEFIDLKNKLGKVGWVLLAK